MFIKFSFKNIYALLLIPSLFLAADFLQNWYIVAISIQLVFLTFFSCHYIIGYINFYLIYLIFQNVGKQIIPETMIPSLACLLISQIFYNKYIKRDEAFIFFLWIGIFSVFSSSFAYLVYSSIAILYFFIQQSSSQNLNFKAIFKTLYTQKLQLLMTSLIAILLFIFFPRFHNFLPSANFKTKGEVGYSQSIDNSNTANLNLSTKTAFYAEINKSIPPQMLYWRGRVHTWTDGYNWKRSRSSFPDRQSKIQKPFSINQFIVKLKYEQDFNGDLILLDLPYKVTKSNFRNYWIKSTNEFKFYQKKKKSSVTSISTKNNIHQKMILSKKNKNILLSLPPFIPKQVRMVSEQLKSNSGAKELIENFKNYIINEKFSYTLNPGPLPTMGSFIKAKKGYCTHYASLLGVILRLNNIPARLISGFQGGKYNEVGDYYEIKSNDAHSWVEYYENENWHRVDPTEFISPERIRFGGTNFMSVTESEDLIKKSNFFLAKYYNDFKQQLDNLNYKVSLFFDNFNKEKQKDISRYFKISMRTFFFIGLFLIIIFVSIYVYFTKYKSKHKYHPADLLLAKLAKKLKLKNNLLQIPTIEEKYSYIQNNYHGKIENNKIKQIINLYQETKYGRNSKIKQLKLKVQKLN